MTIAVSHERQVVPTRQCKDCPVWLPAGSKKQRCEPCATIRLRGQRKVAKQRWADANPEANKVIQARGQFKFKYGVTPDQALVVLESQGGICAMRGCTKRANRVDHCHETGVFRGWLCHGCNVRLSGIEDTSFLASAVEYLDQRREGVMEVALRKHGEGEVIPEADQKTAAVQNETDQQERREALHQENKVDE